MEISGWPFTILLWSLKGRVLLQGLAVFNGKIAKNWAALHFTSRYLHLHIY